MTAVLVKACVKPSFATRRGQSQCKFCHRSKKEEVKMYEVTPLRGHTSQSALLGGLFLAGTDNHLVLLAAGPFSHSHTLALSHSQTPFSVRTPFS